MLVIWERLPNEFVMRGARGFHKSDATNRNLVLKWWMTDVPGFDGRSKQSADRRATYEQVIEGIE